MIPLPSEPKLKNKSTDGKKATFEIEALYPGYGTTIGNSLRRVLLSSLEGAAVTRVKMENVQHEFSTIEGVKEDVINIILNLKQLNFKVFSDDPQKVTLSVKGEKEVKASDFDFPTQVEPVNEDAPIATLTTKSAKLEMEITIEKGIGYVSAEEMKEGKEQVGEITVDAVFTPVKAANFNVENMRVGERTDFDRLTVEVETDGSISPEKAFADSCSTLVEHFNLIKSPFKEEGEEVVKEKKDEEPKKEKDKTDEKPEKNSFDDFDLTSRMKNILKEEKLTPAKVREMKKEDLLELDGIGEKSAERILNAIKKD